MEFPNSQEKDITKKQILGIVELVQVRYGAGWRTIMARIDTGAECSSIDQKFADEIELKKIEKGKIIRSAAGVMRREMLKAMVKIKDQEFETEFTIADRSKMKYKMLIGQNTLREGDFLIDPKINNERRKQKR